MLNRTQRLILANILNKSPDYIFFHEDDLKLNNDDINKLNECIKEFENGKPLSKITNKKEFWNHEFFVTEDTLDPRQDSEGIIEAVLANVRRNKTLKILDIGTGTGCLVISLLDELYNATAVATDISEKALDVAKNNAKSIIGLERIRFIKSDFCDTIDEQFDIIISNPPYIRTGDIPMLEDAVKLYDPLIALDGGADGLNAYRKISTIAQRLLSDDGLLIMEVGHDQMQSVCDIFNNNGYTVKSINKDTLGIDRVVILQR